VNLVRFVVAGRKVGVLQVAFRLRDRGDLSPAERATVSVIGHWLDDNLPKPAKFTRKRNDSHRRPRAISWFKDTAHEHIAKIRELAVLVEARGIAVETILTERPGYIVYEDEFQVAAEPFADTGA